MEVNLQLFSSKAKTTPYPCQTPFIPKVECANFLRSRIIFYSGITIVPSDSISPTLSSLKSATADQPCAQRYQIMGSRRRLRLSPADAHQESGMSSRSARRDMMLRIPPRPSPSFIMSLAEASSGGAKTASA